MRIGLLGLLCLAGVAAWADEAKDLPPEEIIGMFAARKRNSRRPAKLYLPAERQDSGVDGPADRRRASMRLSPTSSSQGMVNAPKKLVRASMSTLSKLLLTPQDEQDLRNVQPFVLTH